MVKALIFINKKEAIGFKTVECAYSRYNRLLSKSKRIALVKLLENGYELIYRDKKVVVQSKEDLYKCLEQIFIL